MTHTLPRALAVLGASALIALAGCSGQPASQDAGDPPAQEGQAEAKTVAEKGDTVKVNYRGTLDDGTQFDSAYGRGEPLEFTVGSGQMISGFDAAVEGMEVGEKKTVRLEPADAYGERSDAMVTTFSKDDVPDFDSLEVGDTVTNPDLAKTLQLTVTLSTSNGSTVAAAVTEKTDDSVTVDANHELAGKPLTFEIELVEVG